MTTAQTIKKILSGSCTPASDLLVQVKHHGLDEREAINAYNADLFPKDRVVTLADAVRNESSFQQRNDI